MEAQGGLREQQVEALRRLHFAANEAAKAFAGTTCEGGLEVLADRARRHLAQLAPRRQLHQ